MNTGMAAGYRHLLPLFFFLASLSVSVSSFEYTNAATRDLITNLPGLTFNPGFKQYSGFLHTPSRNNLHYWLVEAQSNPSTAPLVLWLNGGPGCSSLTGLFTELGPFRVDQDGKTLFENVYSWNKGANVLFLESPYDVGFSYRDPRASPYGWSDNKTAEDNADALAVFFERFPEYQGRPFFITGESYAGIYLPTLANILIERIIAGTLVGVNFVGMAIGNGMLSYAEQLNSEVSLYYYRGITGMEEFDSMRNCCKSLGHKPLSYCNFTSFFDWDTGMPLNKCGVKVVELVSGDDWLDPYNTYQNCYMDVASAASERFLKMNPSLAIMMRNRKPRTPFRAIGARNFFDQGALINIGSTDAQYGFPCWTNDMTTNYLNLPDVRNALHIPSSVPAWQECNFNVNLHFERQYDTMAEVFDRILDYGFPLRILIYNGDTDMVCNFLGDEWFTFSVAKKWKMISDPRYPWTFQENPIFLPQLGGYRKNFTHCNINKICVSIDLVTVKGAGHFVPLDRGGPALQMITNFVENLNFNTSLFWNTTAKETLRQYVSSVTIPETRKEAARVFYLPGLTYTPNFKQYSGFLNGVAGDYLHYWFVESQRSPPTDPLVLWLNGGPGCSSVGGFLSENGPFHPNPDGTTLFENIYSWNKLANVLYLEAPRNVGFSWQNTSINRDPTYNDLKTAHGTFLALMDFLTVFPEYVGRPFYITGESYAGIYIPTLTAYIIDQKSAGKATGLNLVGIAIGNGELSMMEQLNSLMTMLFYRGVYGYTRYSKLMDCCPNSTEPAVYCDFYKFVHFYNGWAESLDDQSECANLIADFGSHYIWENQMIQDVYSLIEDGYRQPYVIYSGQAIRRYSRTLNMLARLKSKQRKPNMARMRTTSKSKAQAQNFNPTWLYGNRRSTINYASTDGKGNFYYYEQDAAPKYMNLPDVRAALNIPPHIQKWSDCNDEINENYDQQHNDTMPVFQHFINTGYPLDILIYSGDVDTACQFLGDQWFVEKLAKSYSMPVTRKWSEWTYSGERAGYWKQFQSPVGTLDFVTVKGAGHFVPLDRPGPALQMLNAFISKQSYSSEVPFYTVLSPLKRQYEIETKIGVAPSGAPNRAKRSVSTVVPVELATEETDRIKNLSGLMFRPKFQQYSGLLSTSNQKQLHYWFFQHENYGQKPLLLWLGDGPACSAIYDAVINIGPYRVDSTGTMLYENPYSWTQAASLLLLEAMPGAGFSSPLDGEYNDNQVVDGLVIALNSFYERFVALKQRPLYTFGKGYGSIYALMLSQKLLSDQSISLAGIGLANGLLSYTTIINTLPNELYFSGLLGKDEWDQLIPCCTVNGVFNNKCDLSQYVTVDSKGVVHAKDQSTCAKLVENYAYEGMLQRKSPSGNMYRNCYKGTIPVNSTAFKSYGRVKRQAYHLDNLPLTNKYPFVNQPTRINYLSTDAFASFPCFMDYASTSYFNLESVQSEFHVPTTNWQKCNPTVDYTRQHFDMTQFFNGIINAANKPLRIIVFDGDSHLYNNFLANEIFIEELAQKKNMPVSAEHNAWTYQESAAYLQQYAGFVKSFQAKASPEITIDLLTVEGAGYYIGLDRPAPTLQMIFNYLNSKQYNTTVAIEPTQASLPAYTPKPSPAVSRKTADQIFDLPGLTYNISFKQYAGYLQATKGNYLHYWFVESQNEPANDPLLVWFTGGPGCSSLGALLGEHGPFRPNPDGRTLFENVFSWNKLANVLYIESPRAVGFSYQDKEQNPSTEWNDDLTKVDAYLAIADFYRVFPELKKNDLYITGESYAGIYVPTLTSLLVDLIKNGTIDFNLKGMIVGNGYLSEIQNIRSLPNFMYFHGLYGKEIWDKLQNMCCNNTAPDLPTTECPFEMYVRINEYGEVIPLTTTPAVRACGELIQLLAYIRVWDTMNYVYNIYQDCYQQTVPILDLGGKQRHRNQAVPEFKPLSEQHRRTVINTLLQKGSTKLQTNIRLAYMKAMPFFVNTFSTDAVGGFQCYMTRGVTEYLRQEHVREALHVPDFIAPWSFCSDINYIKQNNDTTAYFQNILNKQYPLRALIFSGDLDTACSMFESEWFIVGFAKANNMTTLQPQNHWTYQLSREYALQVGGYWKRYKKDQLTIDLLTVKGAGHMVPTDRAGPALQMLTNFVRQQNYSIPSPFSYARQPLLPQFTPLPTEVLPTIPPTPPVTTSQETAQSSPSSSSPKATTTPVTSSTSTPPPVISTTTTIPPVTWTTTTAAPVRSTTTATTTVMPTTTATTTVMPTTTTTVMPTTTATTPVMPTTTATATVMPTTTTAAPDTTEKPNGVAHATFCIRLLFMMPIMNFFFLNVAPHF